MKMRLLPVPLRPILLVIVLLVGCPAIHAAVSPNAPVETVPQAGQSDTSPLSPPPMDAPPMAFVGVGTAPCATFIAIVEAERRARPPTMAGGDSGDMAMTRDYGAFLAWSDGYLTSRNEDSEDDERLAGQSSNHEQRARWLELFCRANPQAIFFAAVYKLHEHLVEIGQ